MLTKLRTRVRLPGSGFHDLGEGCTLGPLHAGLLVVTNLPSDFARGKQGRVDIGVP